MLGNSRYPAFDFRTPAFLREKGRVFGSTPHPALAAAAALAVNSITISPPPTTSSKLIQQTDPLFFPLIVTLDTNILLPSGGVAVSVDLSKLTTVNFVFVSKRLFDSVYPETKGEPIKN